VFAQNPKTADLRFGNNPVNNIADGCAMAEHVATSAFDGENLKPIFNDGQIISEG